MEHTGTLKENLEDYIETRIDLIKFKTAEKGASAISGIIVGVALFIFSMFILLFLSFSAAYAISYATQKPYLGFLAVAGFYILLVVLLLALKEKLITIPIVNTLLGKFYAKQDESKSANEK